MNPKNITEPAKVTLDRIIEGLNEINNCERYIVGAFVSALIASHMGNERTERNG